MALITRNIWQAFHLVTLIWALSLGISSYTTYQKIYNDFVSQQISLTQMSKNSLSAAFSQYEVLLNIVASQVLKNDQIAKKDDLITIMQTATDLDSSVSAFGLFNLDGTIYVSVPITPVPKGDSLLTIIESRETFNDTIKQNDMLIGRTYFSKALDSIIVPFRFTVRDSDGNPRFVLAIAVSIEKGFSFFINSASESSLHDTYLYRSTDRYFQLAPIDLINDAKIYQYQIPQSEVDKAIKRLSSLTSMPLSELKEKEIIFTNEISHSPRQSVSSSVYLKDYSLWLITETKLSTIERTFFEEATVLVLVHLLSIFLIFILFKNIANSEKKKEKELEFQANHDYLTHLWNRYYFDRYLAKVDSNSVFSLIYLNVDHFKDVNDNHGHAVGDQLLKEIAVILSAIAQQDDLVIRSNSDEFILICFHQTEQQISEVCNQLLASFHQPFLQGDSEITLSASIGVSCYPKDGTNPEDIKRNADLAANYAKKERNTAVFFNQSLLKEHLYQRNIEQALKKAVDNQELYMLYQPQLSPNGHVIGVEALIRWQNEKLGFMPPDKFIPVAESTGMMDVIGAFVIERSLHDMMRLQERTGLQFSVSINVSVKQFKNPDFFDKLMALVNYSHFPTELLILEITESVLIDDIDAMQHLMVKIKAQNIRISLDDFGTGYSSLSILNNLPIDELKIDKSFVNNVINDDETRSMISSMISIAKSKKMKTVAEGIETKEMLLVLQELGCDIYQGYYFSKPIDKDQLEVFIQENNR